MNCYKCQRELIPLDQSFSQKLLGRGTQQCLCIRCLEKGMGLTRTQMKSMADRWQKEGCTLFAYSGEIELPAEEDETPVS